MQKCKHSPFCVFFCVNRFFYTKNKHRQIIIYKLDFNNVKLLVALNNEFCTNTCLENTLTIFTKSRISAQRFVLLPIDWDKKFSLFTKRIHIMI